MDSQKTVEPMEFQLKGLDCLDCAESLEKAVTLLPNVDSAHILYAASKMVVVPKDGAEVTESVRDVVESMGYQIVSPNRPTASVSNSWRKWVEAHRRDLATGVGGVLIVVAFVLHLLRVPGALVNALYGASILVGGFHVARSGWVALQKARSLDMNALMTIAAVGAMAIGAFEEGAITIFLFSIGELLESYSVGRARNAVRTLMELAPEEATLLLAEGERRVPVAQINVGERILVRPGERFPMDGRVLEGASAVNQAPITGESIPVEKNVGDEVFAGSLNGNGALTVEVTRLARDNTIARIMRLIEEAQSQRAPSQRFVDRFARVYTPIVIGAAVLVMAVPPLVGLGSFREWFYRALVLLVISCPCALVISTPITIVSSLARAARSGVLIKGGAYLEKLASLRVMAFDKTGTLTKGNPTVVGGGCERHVGATEECNTCMDLLAKAAAVESRSEHALARAVTQYAEEKGINGRHIVGENVTATTGRGIRGTVEGHAVSVGNLAFSREGNGESHPLDEAILAAEKEGNTVLVIDDGCCGARCYLTVADGLREGAHEAVEGVKHWGIDRAVMLTGDNPMIAKGLAQKAGIDEYWAELLPEDKVRVVEELRTLYGPIAMVGDGVNDAPAMARSDVGIAMGAAGTDTALEAADIALMSDDLSRLPFVLRLSRRAMGTVRANIVFSLLFKMLFLALAVVGISTLWMAVLADTGASLIVSLNGLRMLGMRENRGG
ncbi:MAG: cadmium-translocating P-type ATPase [Chloroflexi bacterium RBG_13_56_8]|nr:MAG: cadmium-translocating P-type ATPase [Chloroflexi bacterium RBG_13_56_8]